LQKKGSLDYHLTLIKSLKNLIQSSGVCQKSHQRGRSRGRFIFSTLLQLLLLEKVGHEFVIIAMLLFVVVCACPFVMTHGFCQHASNII
jgi:hypothetical protein